MRLYDLLGGLDALHLRHGDIHQYDVGMRALEFADRSQPVTGLGRHLPAETFNHAGEILAREHGIVHDQVADRLAVLTAFYWCKLLHNNLPVTFHHGGCPPTRYLRSIGPGSKNSF